MNRFRKTVAQHRRLMAGKSAHQPRSRAMKNTHLLRTVQAIILSLGSPVGWLIVQGLQGESPMESVQRDPGIYLYLLFGTMAVFSAFGWYVGRQEEEAILYSLKDPLTGLPNRLSYAESIRQAFLQLQRYPERSIALLMIDIDHFKRVNDRFGHDFGDTVLCQVAVVLQKELRATEALYRVGGEEFVVLAAGAGLSEAYLVAERLRQRLEAEPIETPGSHGPLKVTISIGIASCDGSGDAGADALYRNADNAMYSAKQHGRNQTRIFSDPHIKAAPEPSPK